METIPFSGCCIKYVWDETGMKHKKLEKRKKRVVDLSDRYVCMFLCCASVCLCPAQPLQHHLHHCTAGCVSPCRARIFTEHSTSPGNCGRKGGKKAGRRDRWGERVPQEREMCGHEASRWCEAWHPSRWRKMNDGQQARLMARVQLRVAGDAESCHKDVSSELWALHVRHWSEDYIHLFILTH